MTKQTKQTDELAALRARVEELERERKAQPPKPFKEEPWQRYDPTANMSMPASALAAMVAAVPTDMVRGIVRDNQGPQGPSAQGGVPSSQQLTGVHPGGGSNTTGWREARPLGPPPGINYVDALCVADDVRQRSKK
jgi:hypothetical protein